MEAFFLPVDDGRKGQRFCLFHPAQGGLRGSVVYVHPFAEEMNKSRRMAALQARALAEAGYAVLQIDLLGCGDSSGDFADATWEDWIADVVLACRWLTARQAAADQADGRHALWLWGLRAGCLVATAAAARLPGPCNFLFWQPPSSGKPLLQQFMRLKAAGDMLGGNAKAIMDSLRQRLDAGGAMEIAGYEVAPGLAMGLEQAALQLPEDSGGVPRVAWFEMSTRDDAAITPASANTILKWQQRGAQVESHVVQGPSFWQTTEIEDAPALVAATLAAMSP